MGERELPRYVVAYTRVVGAVPAILFYSDKAKAELKVAACRAAGQKVAMRELGRGDSAGEEDEGVQ